MGTVVMKFGGSSVASLDKLREVARQVVARRRAGERVVVVVSAMGKTTDALIAQARELSPAPPRRELDMLVTAGERIAMALLSMAIAREGEDAISFTGSQSGIITDDEHQNARIVEVRPERIAAALDDGRIVIVAGYQGVSRRREVTTLGRGGSDTTAVALAAALLADVCEIYSDVDGVYSADPSVCADARLLPELGYEPMQRMAAFGAKVLNAQAVEHARKAGIVIHARKTGDDSGRQTRVHENAPLPSGVIAVVGASAVSWVQGPSTQASALIASALACGARPMAQWEGPRTLDVLFDRTGCPGQDPALLADLCARAGFSAREVAVVTLIGTELTGRPTMRETVREVLGEEGMELLGLHATEHAMALVLEPGAARAATAALHAALVGEAVSR